MRCRILTANNLQKICNKQSSIKSGKYLPGIISMSLHSLKDLQTHLCSNKIVSWSLFTDLWSVAVRWEDPAKMLFWSRTRDFLSHSVDLSVCLSVCPSVCQSVTVYFFSTNRWLNFQYCPCLTYATDAVVYTALFNYQVLIVFYLITKC